MDYKTKVIEGHHYINMEYIRRSFLFSLLTSVVHYNLAHELQITHRDTLQIMYIRRTITPFYTSSSRKHQHLQSNSVKLHKCTEKNMALI